MDHHLHSSLHALYFNYKLYFQSDFFFRIIECMNIYFFYVCFLLSEHDFEKKLTIQIYITILIDNNTH